MKSAFTKILAVTALTAALSVSAADKNQQTTSTTEQQSDTSSKMNPTTFQKTAFLNQLHHLNQKEIKISQLAMDKSENPQIKDMAKHMVSDHQKAENQVKQVAQAEKIELMDFQPSTHDKVAMENFEKLKGSEFDMAFIEFMRHGHTQAVEELQLVSKSAKDPQIKSLVQSMLPTIRDHQKMAAKLKASTAKQMAGQAQE